MKTRADGSSGVGVIIFLVRGAGGSTGAADRQILAVADRSRGETSALFWQATRDRIGADAQVFDVKGLKGADGRLEMGTCHAPCVLLLNVAWG